MSQYFERRPGVHRLHFWDMRRHSGVIALGGALAAWLACSETETRPPSVGDCSAPECLVDRNGTPPDVVLGGPGGVAGGGGDGGAAGTSGMPPPGAGALLGTVSTIVELDLSRSGAPEIPVEIRVPSGAGTDIVATSGTDGSFRLDGVPRDEALWAAVGTFSDLDTQVFMDTLQVVDSAAGQAVELGVMRRSVMDELASSSYLVETVELDPARGHALIRFVDASGDPVQGVSVVFPTSENADIAYDAGEIYTDAAFETSTRGAVALLNLASPAYPGAVASLLVEVDSPTAREFSAILRVASGSVTLLTVELDLTP